MSFSLLPGVTEVSAATADRHGGYGFKDRQQQKRNTQVSTVARQSGATPAEMTVFLVDFQLVARLASDYELVAGYFDPSLARRRPENCQRVAGVKKFR